MKTDVNNILIEKGFSIKKSEVSDSFGDSSKVYTNNKINVKLVSDRLIESLSISSSIEPETWYDLSLIIQMLSKEEKNRMAYSIEAEVIFFYNSVKI